MTPPRCVVPKQRSDCFSPSEWGGANHTRQPLTCLGLGRVESRPRSVRALTEYFRTVEIANSFPLARGDRALRPTPTSCFTFMGVTSRHRTVSKYLPHSCRCIRLNQDRSSPEFCLLSCFGRVEKFQKSVHLPTHLDFVAVRINSVHALQTKPHNRRYGLHT